MKKRIYMLALSLLFLAGCGTKDYLRTANAAELVEEDIIEETVEVSKIESPMNSTILIQLAGEVKKPGVYEIHEGARLYEAIELAGGFTEAAAKDVNQVQSLADGQYVSIPTAEEFEEQKQIEKEVQDGLVDINTASVADFCTLPGIGESKANQIIAYREANGGFSSKEDLMQISGIKEGTYKKIEAYITVR